MKALALMPRERHAAPLKRAIDFLLAHRIYFSHTTGKPVRKFWPAHIQFPTHYAYDLLHPLRTLTLARSGWDPRLNDALDALESRADARARWCIDYAPPAMELEPAGRPSKWATVSALTVMRHFGRAEIVP